MADVCVYDAVAVTADVLPNFGTQAQNFIRVLCMTVITHNSDFID